MAAAEASLTSGRNTKMLRLRTSFDPQLLARRACVGAAMENMPLEVPVGEAAALPTRPRNRHKRERDVSHLCPTAVRLAQRKDEIVRAWRERESSPAPECSYRPRVLAAPSAPSSVKVSDARIGASLPVQANPTPKHKYSILEEYSVSDEDYGGSVYEICNDDVRMVNDSSEEDSYSEADSQASDSVSSNTMERTYCK